MSIFQKRLECKTILGTARNDEQGEGCCFICCLAYRSLALLMLHRNDRGAADACVAIAGIRDRPQVMDYIYLTAEVQSIQKQLGDWDRKLEIAHMEEKRTRKMYKTLSQAMNHLAAGISNSPAAALQQ